MRRVILLIICVILLCEVALSESAWPVFDDAGYYSNNGNVQALEITGPTNTARPVQKNSSKSSSGGTIDGDIFILLILALIIGLPSAKQNKKKREQKKRTHDRAYRQTRYKPRHVSERVIRQMMREDADKALNERTRARVQYTHTLDELTGMTGRQFEFFVAELMKRNGYTNVYTTTASGDYGADVIAVDREGVKVAIQCKLWRESVGNKAVQEAYSAMAFYDCAKSMVITNSSFTPSAIETAKKTGTILCDKNGLLALMNNDTSENIAGTNELACQERRAQEATIYGNGNTDGL